jgi:hypothetical protein
MSNHIPIFTIHHGIIIISVVCCAVVEMFVLYPIPERSICFLFIILHDILILLFPHLIVPLPIDTALPTNATSTSNA